LETDANNEITAI